MKFATELEIVEFYIKKKALYPWGQQRKTDVLIENKLERKSSSILSAIVALLSWGTLDIIGLFLYDDRNRYVNREKKGSGGDKLVLTLTSRQIVEQSEDFYGIGYFYGNAFKNNISIGYISINDCSYKDINTLIKTRLKAGKKLWKYRAKKNI